jgi:transposase
MKTNRERKVYLAIDAHAGHCVLGVMREDGEWLGEERFATNAKELIDRVEKVNASEKELTFEEGPMAQWMAEALRGRVKRLVVCDPRENALIARSAKKRDGWDVRALCRLLRLGELKEVYHGEGMERATFKAAVQHYLGMRDEVVRLKNRIKSRCRRFGVMEVAGKRLYALRERSHQITRMPEGSPRNQVGGLLRMLDAGVEEQKRALQEVERLGSAYAEIKEFKKMTGIGPVGAHVFDAYIQTPDRFKSAARLWSYCRLGISERSSDGKPLGYQRLDRNGNAELKMMSYHAWKAAVATKRPNEVKAFYEASLKRTFDRRHARLNTQRKILAVLWTLWRKRASYEAEHFSGNQDRRENGVGSAA